MRNFVDVVAFAVLFCACHNGQSLKPRSGGRPYEVLLVTDDNELRQTMDSILTVDVPALPQGEAMFTLSHSENKTLNQSMRYARCIVMVTKNSAFGRLRMKYEENVYAKPQLIVHVYTSSSADLIKAAKRLTVLIDRFELKACAESFENGQSTMIAHEVESMFGWQMLVPEEMVSMKRGHDFIWASDNGKLSSGNICVYSYNGMALDAKTLIDKRDSIMACNIPGEAPQMCMATERQFPIVTEKYGKRLLCRGLWQMEHDAMGGPFVCYAEIDNVQRRVVVAEAFVYAPGRKKRNKMKRLEAALQTMKKKQK